MIATLALAASPAQAGGGAHAVDDDATLPDGVCHLESWISLSNQSSGVLVANPACTPAALPGLEIAAGVQRRWGYDQATAIAPSFKLNLRSFEEAPVGMAVSGTMVWNLAEGRVESLAFAVPLSAHVDGRLVMHGNLGWVHQPVGEERDALFWGMQAEYSLRPDLVLMGEVFGSDNGAPGTQAGLRWVRNRGLIDIDLLAGRRTDGSDAFTMTLGVTIRTGG